jgi:hypothetical protein
MLKKYLITISLIILFILLAIQEARKKMFEADIHHQIDEALKNSTKASEDFPDNDNFMKILEDGYKFTERQVQAHFRNRSKEGTTAGFAYWSFDNKFPMAASAFGTDFLHHFVNHYLIGYAPFKTEQLWIPHYTITMRLRYQLDAEQYGGLREVWQNSREAFFNTRGDCEDHALVLADWLIEMGIDARVALGTYKKEGHAWVVVFKGSEVFLLEATSKQKRKQWRHYPLAKLEPNYHPKCMFDRNHFWVNTGSMFTTNYLGKQWVKKSKFFRNRKQSS